VKKNNRLIRALIGAWMVSLSVSCGPSQVKPVDIYPEDNCSNCRMAVSDKAFSSEIITEEGEVFKFDDLSCLAAYRKSNPSLKIGTIFVTDYETMEWLPYAKSIVVRTGLATPMGSGNVAVADSQRASSLVERFPPTENATRAEDECCPEHDK